MRHGSRTVRTAVGLGVAGLALSTAVGAGVTSAGGSAATSVDEDATIVVASNSWDSLDPAVSVGSPTGRWLNPVYELLVRLLPDGSYGPGLAREWSFLDVDGQAVLQLVLQEGVAFHDGTPFDADAVKANLDRYMASDAYVRNYVQTIEDVAVVDPMRVNITLTPGSGYDALWGFTQTAGRMVSPTAFDQAATHPVGTGPFIFESSAADTVTYVRNPDYWNGPPQYETLVIQSLTSNNTPWITGLLSGAIDVGRLVGPTEAELAQVENTPGFIVEKLPVGQFDFISLNRARPPFDDPRMRQAVAYALDYDAMTEAFGYEPVRQPVLPGTTVYDEALDGNYTYNPERARQLIAEAGYPDGIDVGELSFTVSGTLPRLAQVAQQQLAEVGIRVTLRQFENTAQTLEACGDGDCLILAFASLTWDPLYLAKTMMSSFASPNNPGGQPPTGQLAELLAQAQQPASQSEHDGYMRELVAAMNTEAINVFTGLVPHYAIYRDDIHNVTEGWFVEAHPDHGLLYVGD